MTDWLEPVAEAGRPAREPRKHQRHVWVLDPVADVIRCTSCPAIRDETLVRRGRTNRARGNAIEREVGKRLGLRRIGQYGGPTDVGSINEPFAVSVKSGSGYFSERYWDQLKRQKVVAGQTALLVVTDAPGPGHARRAVVVLDIADWIELHGLAGVADVP